jgi:5-methylcytosine-specific restriction endonuclease McrA
MLITNDQRQFLLLLANNFVPLMKRDVKLRNDLRSTYSEYSMKGRAIEGIRYVIRETCGECEFSNETIKPFIKAIVVHLQGYKPPREQMPQEEQDRLLIACGMKCQSCGKLLTDVNFDHILPYCLVFDTIKDNIQCLCPECNKAKGTTIPFGVERACA